MAPLFLYLHMSRRLQPLRDLLTKVIKLNPDKILKQALDGSELQEKIIDLNFESQLYEAGITADGKSLGSYSPVTIQIKQERGQRTDHITLRDTGDFYNSAKFINKPKEFIIVADTLKIDEQTGETTDLVKEYGNILGLSKESKTVLKPEIRRDMLFFIRQAVKR